MRLKGGISVDEIKCFVLPLYDLFGWRMDEINSGISSKIEPEMMIFIQIQPKKMIFDVILVGQNDVK